MLMAPGYAWVLWQAGGAVWVEYFADDVKPFAGLNDSRCGLPIPAGAEAGRGIERIGGEPVGAIRLLRSSETIHACFPLASGRVAGALTHIVHESALGVFVGKLKDIGPNPGFPGEISSGRDGKRGIGGDCQVLFRAVEIASRIPIRHSRRRR